MTDDRRYRLAPVRDVRARDEALRRGDLAHAVGDARETQSRLDAARERTELAARSLDTARAEAAKQATSQGLALAERFVARRRRDLADARDVELRAAAVHDHQLGAVDVARGRLARARADRELIERHFARWREAQAKLAERRRDE